MSVNKVNQQQGLIGNVAALADSNIVLSPAPATIDGVALNTGDKVLLTAQTDPVDNGVYFYTGAELIRPIHDDNLAIGYTGLALGSRVWVVNGATYGATDWIFSDSNSANLDGYETAVATIGTHSQIYTQIQRGGTTQGLDGVRDLRATDEGTVAATVPRGNYSVDLQTIRSAGTQVASGNQSTIVAGNGNTAAGIRSAVVGGLTNQSNGANVIVAGGSGNVATTGGIFSGSNCQTSGTGPAAVGGSENIISGNWSTALGGLSNSITSVRSATIGGNGNIVSHNDTVLLGMANFSTDAASTTYVRNLYIQTGLRLPTGATNGYVLTSDATGTATWQASAGGGGSGGTVQGTDGTYDIQPTNEGATAGNARGENSVDLQTSRSAATAVASGQGSTISGGNSNTASGNSSTIGGGNSNTATNAYSTVGGGNANDASGNSSTIGGGNNNDASGTYATVSGGTNNFSGPGSYSTIGGGSSNDASGTYVTISGGNNNDASGVFATIGGGNYNEASGAYATIGGGYNAKADKWGQQAYASGQFGAKGDAQDGKYILRHSTTDAATATELFLDGASARLIIPAEYTFTFSIRLAAYNTTDNIGAGWTVTGAIRRDNANSTSLIGNTITQTYTEGAMSGCVVAVTADDANEALVVTVNGLAAKTVRWTATVDTTETGFTLR